VHQQLQNIVLTAVCHHLAVLLSYVIALVQVGSSTAAAAAPTSLSSQQEQHPQNPSNRISQLLLPLTCL
jgi:hypothetical protein